MTTSDICTIFADGLGPLFTCEVKGDRTRIRTPYLYPDGDYIDVFCRRMSDNLIVVSDLGETTRWLRMQTHVLRRTTKQRALITDVCLNHGVEFYRGALMARCKDEKDLAFVVTRVGQAAMRVADIWFTFRTRSLESAKDDVSAFLSEREFSYTTNEKLPGKSGRVWTPDFHVRSVARSSLVYVLATGSRSAARPVVHTVFTAYSDLGHLAIGPEAIQFVSLFDDAADVWSDEDYKLAGQVSEVVRWSNPDEFASVLLGAA